ncbi:MAG: 2-C-methyl-D-erythritol 2,4-cyclodiphosphate synthase [Candidatus Dormibacteria bacterium]|jgi:2-C-methyl-D-erythritol 2,4-cyclodiphosphate synthase
MTMRIGHGVDAHRLVEGRPLMLGGVHIPHDRGLAGHSDGDAVAHALCDALLGAAGLGDMGRHFPSSQARWRDTAGADFLRAVATMLRERGLRVVSAQAIAIAQEPRLADRLEAMAVACSAALGIDRALLQVTATSTDGMGFTGTGEGIAASAVALLDLAR